MLLKNDCTGKLRTRKLRPGLPNSAEQYTPNCKQINIKTKKYIPNRSEKSNQKLNITQIFSPFAYPEKAVLFRSSFSAVPFFFAD